MILLLTATVRPTEKVPHTKLKDSQIRLQHYQDACNFYLSKHTVHAITLCENSSCPPDAFAAIQAQAHRRRKSFEYLTYQGDEQQQALFGKSYGEGHIIDYAMEHSAILREHDFFVKITGRYQVKNISALMTLIRFNRSLIYINRANTPSSGSRLAEISVYAMPTQVYRTNFQRLYLEADEKKGRFLEHCFYERICSERLESRNFPLHPRLEGISGASARPRGAPGSSVLRRWRKDLQSLLGYYSIQC